MSRRLWIDTTGEPVITTTPNGERNAERWGWTEAAAVPSGLASQLRAFARLCVDGGDMTPTAARMLDRIIDGDGRADQ